MLVVWDLAGRECETKKKGGEEEGGGGLTPAVPCFFFLFAFASARLCPLPSRSPGVNASRIERAIVLGSTRDSGGARAPFRRMGAGRGREGEQSVGGGRGESPPTEWGGLSFFTHRPVVARVLDALVVVNAEFLRGLVDLQGLGKRRAEG